MEAIFFCVRRIASFCPWARVAGKPGRFDDESR
jgi:hypothetical protein